MGRGRKRSSRKRHDSSPVPRLWSWPFSQEPRCCGPDATASTSDSLRSCTSKVTPSPYVQSASCTIYLIDTPGFDDSDKSDTEVLNKLAAWFVGLRVGKILLHGIIYLHRIIDPRMQGSTKKNLVLFKKLCGQNALKNVVLVTTMWNGISNDLYRSREKELTTTSEFWGYMMEQGSSCFRADSPGSERQIVQHLASHNNPVAIDLQTQLVDERRRLDETSAGQELQTEVAKDKRRWERAVRETRTGMREAKKQSDYESLRVLEEELRRCRSEIKRSEERRCMLGISMKGLLDLYHKQVAYMEAQQASHHEPPVGVELPSLEYQAQPTGQPIEVEQPSTTPGPSNELVLYGTNDMSEIPAQDHR
ncbi:uncharacterized protein NECHADRAFT_78004 [Fusarium vanettenii 77-13-4]|uniref:G domain-containing protein n=1 Tax=Fusarium vanettenii (strain ATCC MYA-4622 / CBS 123669 / FGSC 9596 / NRRL 45880 / 77-13-4) TaxID=660122 RepID=C7YMU8_FUSV7|nr:uncharacterized protein NECHADRAFT_78004 [Fusarium vanettenii 77-13-4]EEU47509.1 hypothetical protein NECHADRAFT_78004 [Fusarium vanettenii 77-13-4]